MNGLKYIIEMEEDHIMLASYYIREPNNTIGEYAGGFGYMNKAIVFDSIILAHIARRRLTKIYSDIPAKLKVITLTAKELFKVKLGAQI